MFPLVEGADIRFGTADLGTQKGASTSPPRNDIWARFNEARIQLLDEIDSIIQPINIAIDIANKLANPINIITSIFGGENIFDPIPKIPSASALLRIPRLKLDVDGDVWINNTNSPNNNPENIGKRGIDGGFRTLVHEIGHALGLKHPGNYNASGGGADGPYLPAEKDSYQYSIMSYDYAVDPNGNLLKDSNGNPIKRSRLGYPRTPMLYDIAAIQHLYGVNYKTRSSNTTYVYSDSKNQVDEDGKPVDLDENGNPRPFMATIWDAGGHDTIDASNHQWYRDIIINLNPGTFSSVGPLNQVTNITDSQEKYNLAIAYGVTIENAIGGAGNDILIGNSVSNVLKGGAGDDKLTGGAGADTLIGDDGIDTVSYANSGTGVSVNLTTGKGSGGDAEEDTLQSIENLEGSQYTDILVGDAAGNVLTGGDGDDILDGGLGDDSMLGGKGNDTYYVDSINDVITEYLNEGIDIVYSSVSYTLTNNTENLTLTGNNPINGTGNSLNNIITGNNANNSLNGEAGNDTLYGKDGDDTLDGGSGADSMFGGQGNDTYYVDNISDSISEYLGEGSDTVYSSISYTLSKYVENLTLTGNSLISGFGNIINNIINGNNVDNTLDGKAGNDELHGRDGNDELIGGEGSDLIDGGNGNDTASYFTSNAGVTINLTTGQATGGDANGDILLLIENLKGSEFGDSLIGDNQNNHLWGFSGDDILNGLAGADIMEGGTGNDTYYVDNASDAVIEYANQGTDTVYSLITYTLGDKLENLTLTGNIATNGIGNIINNIINGSDAANTLDGKAGSDILFGNGGNDSLFGDIGDDKLIGGIGGDILNGGAGNDTASYFNATSGIIVNLSTGQGTEGEASGDVYQFIENLEGSEFNDRLFGNNENNTLIGLGGDDFLDGYGGNDTLIGGQGSDIYNVDSAGDIVTENLNEGIDTVNAAISHTLAANLENLNLLEGTVALNGTGNELSNTINGNSANNILNGGAGDDRLYGFAGGDTLQGGDGNDWIIGGQGNDILTGGAGNDYFACNAITDAGDRITDFTVGSDKLVLTDLLKNLGYKGSNAIADGILGFKQASSSLAIVQIDPDGTASNLFRAAPFMLLDNVSVTALNNSNNFVF